jgi:glycosyltransferase involved in cell wall biosynthesis
VIPLRDAEFNAGVTVLAEAMAMGKAVVLSRTRGMAGAIRDGEHGIYVPPGDPAALRAAIEYLSVHPDEAERMGRAGRALVRERHAMDICIPRLADLVRASSRPEERRAA